MKNTLLLAVGLLFAGAAAHAQSTTLAPTMTTKPGKPGKVAGPMIEFSEVKYDFGTIKQGEAAEHVFKFKNTGTAPLVISNIGVTCGCTTPTWTKEPVQPGKNGTITAHFNSAGKSGPQNKVLTIESNAMTMKDGAMVPYTPTVALVGEVKEPATAQAPAGK